MSLRVAVMLATAAGVCSLHPPSLAGRQVLPDTLDGEAYRVLAGTRVRVRFARRDSLAAPRILAFLQDQPPLPGLPAAFPTDVTAVLAHSSRAFDELTGGTVPEWRAGIAIPSAAMLVIPTGEGRPLLGVEGSRVLRHEWAHLGLHDYLGGARVPRWFDEGYAQWASGGWDIGDAWRLRLLLALGRAPPLDSISLTWPRDRASAEAAYLLSASAVAYLLGESGNRGLALFLERWRRERAFESALRTTFGVTSGQFEEDWRRYVRDRYGWMLVLSHSAVFWMLLALVLLVMVRVRSRRDREQMARLRAREAPDQPEFWALDDQAGGPAKGEGG